MFYTTELNTYHCCSLQHNETLNLKKTKRSTRLALDWQTTARQRGWSRVRFPGPESYGCTVFALQKAWLYFCMVRVAQYSRNSGIFSTGRAKNRVLNSINLFMVTLTLELGLGTLSDKYNLYSISVVFSKKKQTPLT